LSFSGFLVLGLWQNRKTGFSKIPVFSGIPKTRHSLLKTYLNSSNDAIIKTSCSVTEFYSSADNLAGLIYENF
jgi:hypothetical protein